MATYYKGSVRTWKGFEEDWNKHKDVIIGWCNGRDVDFQLFGKNMTQDVPDFNHRLRWRLVPERPEAGTVFLDEKGVVCIAIHEELEAREHFCVVSTDGDGFYDYRSRRINKVADNLEEYYARKFYKQGDCAVSVTMALQKAANLKEDEL